MVVHSMLKKTLLCLSLLLAVCLSHAQVDKDDRAVYQWTKKIIRPFFVSTDLERVKTWFSAKTWPEARKIRKTLQVSKFGKVELEQRATIDNVPAWRMLVAITAKDAENKAPLKITLRLLILRGPDNNFKITHIDKFETKPSSAKQK